MGASLPTWCCPRCHEPLGQAGSASSCATCKRHFPTVDGIPVLTLEDVGQLTRRQAAWFDQPPDADFETERPRGAPPLYRWYYLDKFRRSMSGLTRDLAGMTALTVCGGSGMDAEFLARCGANVICSDISLGAVRRARERARSHSVAITPLVADAERLPLADRSVDIVYVHDGLHHLERPLTALREMARVSRVAISVNEPARAALTSLAVRLGLALEFEEAGNRVARLAPALLTDALEQGGFQVTAAARYGMYFKHEPGRVIAALSRPRVLPTVKLALQTLNALGGRYGNKLTVQAVRVDEPAAEGAR